MKSISLVPLLLLLCFRPAQLMASEALEEDSLEKDYASQLVRTPPREPPEALATFQVADGFRIERVAAEPLVSDPVALAFDEHGRLLVVQMNGYSEQGEENLGVVRRLEDTDRDGVFDRGTDYVRGLSWPTAIACYDGGVFVGAAPDILYCKDTDNDGTADIRRVVFRGFGQQNVQGLLNSFLWGFDNRLFASASSNGGSIRMLQHPDRSPVVLRRQDFAIDPYTLELSAVSGGGQHGMSLDRWGDRYVSSNSNHLQWVEFEARYLNRNPLLEAPPATRNIAVDGPAAEVFRSSPVETWRLVRTRLRVKGMVSGPVEGGGRAAGYFTGASGVTLYTGDAYPERFRNATFAFVGDVGGNLVHLKRVEDQGLSKVARRVVEGREFLTSTDNWFRPAQFANGPDGALYVIDMYREVIEHPKSLPPLIKQHLDLTSGRGRGRIYRIVPTDFQQPGRSLPGEVSDLELVPMLEHANGWHRETAARLITTRARRLLEASPASDPRLVTRWKIQLRKLVRDSASPDARIRALYCLASLDKLDAETLVCGLRDPHRQVRRHAIRVAETAQKSPELVRRLQDLAGDPEINVRYQLALSLGELDWPDRSEPLLQIARQDMADAKIRFATVSSAVGGRYALLEALWDDETSGPPRDGRTELLTEILGQIGAGRQEDVARALNLLRCVRSATARRLMVPLLVGTGERGPELVSLLTRLGVEDARRFMDQRLAAARREAADPHHIIDGRLAALRLLKLAEFDRVEGTLRTLLSTEQPPAVRSAAVRILGSFRSPSVAGVLLDAAPSLSPRERRQAFDLVCSRPEWILELLGRIEDEEIRSADVSSQHRQLLLQHRDNAIAQRAESLLGVDLGRGEIVQQYQDVLKMNGDEARGRELFRKTCEVCHGLEGTGNHVGPDLAPLRNRGAAFMLTNILDPNREVDARYESYIVLNEDGQSFAGIIASESARAITILQADGQSLSIRRTDIAELRSTGKSLMPEGLERELDRQRLADLISYLCTDEY